MIEKIGDPGAIRTRDPQIRKLGPDVELIHFPRKPSPNPAIRNQLLSTRSANQNGGLAVARGMLWTCAAITLCALIFLAAQTETGRHLLMLLVTGGATG